MSTFIQVLFGLTEVLSVLQCSLKSPYTNSQIYSSRNIYPMASRFPHRSDLSYALVCVPVYVPGLTDRSQPIRSSACSADPADVELVSQHSPSTSTSRSPLWFLLAPRLPRALRPVRLHALRPFQSACLLTRPFSTPSLWMLLRLLQ